MKKILLTVSIAVLSITSAIAQDTGSGINKILLTGYLEETKINEITIDNNILTICPRSEKSFVNLEPNETFFTGPSRVIIYDVLGNISWSKKCLFEDGICIEMSLEILSRGVYFLHMTNGKENITRKIILN